MSVKNIQQIRKLLFASILLAVAANAQEEDLFALQNPADMAAEETAVDEDTVDQAVVVETGAEQALADEGLPEEALIEEALIDANRSDQTNVDITAPDAEISPQEAALEEQHIDATLKNLSQVTVRGAKVIEFWRHPETDTVYALVRTDLSTMKSAITDMRDIDPEFRDYVNVNAEQAFKNLDRQAKEAK